MNSHKLCKTFIAAFTAFTFIVTSLGISPNAFAAAAMPEVSFPYQIAIDRTLGLAIPQEFGKLEHFNMGQGPAIFHIQTAHGHYQAQQQIRSLLHYLDKNYGVKTLLVEGSAFDLDPELIRFFPNDKAKTLKVADALTRHALLKGPELFLLDKQFEIARTIKQKTTDLRLQTTANALGLQSPEGVHAFGIEELQSYRANGVAFVEVLRAQQKTVQFLADMNMQIERLSSHYLNKDLRGFLRRVEGFEKNRIPLDTWLANLKDEAQKRLGIDLASPAEQVEWPMLVRVFKTQELSAKLDRQKLPKERNEFLKAIRRFLPSKTIDHSLQTTAKTGLPLTMDHGLSTSAQVEALLKSETQSVQLPDPETSLLFEDMVKALPANFNYDLFPNVRYFIGTLLLHSELKADRLMQEVQKLSDKIVTKLTRNKEETKLIALLADHRLLQKLFALELTPDDYDSILARKDGLRPSKIVEQLTGTEYGVRRRIHAVRRTKLVEFSHISELDQLFASAMKFYSGVKERDGKMEARIEERLKETGATKVAVITGGFHSGPFQKYFTDKNYTYALITPKLNGADEAGYQAYINSTLSMTSPAPQSSTRELPFLSDPQFASKTGPYEVDTARVRAEVRNIIAEVVGRSEARIESKVVNFSVSGRNVSFTIPKAEQDGVVPSEAVRSALQANGLAAESFENFKVTLEKQSPVGLAIQDSSRWENFQNQEAMDRWLNGYEGSIKFSGFLGAGQAFDATPLTKGPDSHSLKPAVSRHTIIFWTLIALGGLAEIFIVANGLISDRDHSAIVSKSSQISSGKDSTEGKEWKLREALYRLHSGSDYTREFAAQDLGDLGDLRALAALIEVLKDKAPNVRRVAAEALGKLGNPEALPALAEASSKEPVFSVQTEINLAVKKIRNASRSEARSTSSGQARGIKASPKVVTVPMREVSIPEIVREGARLEPVTDRSELLRIMGQVGNVGYESIFSAIREGRFVSALALVDRALNGFQGKMMGRKITADQRRWVGGMGELERSLDKLVARQWQGVSQTISGFLVKNQAKASFSVKVNPDEEGMRIERVRNAGEGERKGYLDVTVTVGLIGLSEFKEKLLQSFPVPSDWRVSRAEWIRFINGLSFDDVPVAKQIGSGSAVTNLASTDVELPSRSEVRLAPDEEKELQRAMKDLKSRWLDRLLQGSSASRQSSAINQAATLLKIPKESSRFFRMFIQALGKVTDLERVLWAKISLPQLLAEIATAEKAGKDFQVVFTPSGASAGILDPTQIQKIEIKPVLQSEGRSELRRANAVRKIAIAAVVGVMAFFMGPAAAKAPGATRTKPANVQTVSQASQPKILTKEDVAKLVAQFAQTGENYNFFKGFPVLDDALVGIGVPVIPDLIEALRDQSNSALARKRFMSVLANMGIPAVPALTEILQNEQNIGVREVVAGALAKIGEPRSARLAVWDNSNWQTRDQKKEAIRELREIPMSLQDRIVSEFWIHRYLYASFAGLIALFVTMIFKMPIFQRQTLPSKSLSDTGPSEVIVPREGTQEDSVLADLITSLQAPNAEIARTLLALNLTGLQPLFRYLEWIRDDSGTYEGLSAEDTLRVREALRSGDTLHVDYHQSKATAGKPEYGGAYGQEIVGYSKAQPARLDIAVRTNAHAKATAPLTLPSKTLPFISSHDTIAPRAIVSPAPVLSQAPSSSPDLEFWELKTEAFDPFRVGTEVISTEAIKTALQERSWLWNYFGKTWETSQREGAVTRIGVVRAKVLAIYGILVANGLVSEKSPLVSLYLTGSYLWRSDPNDVDIVAVVAGDRSFERFSEANLSVKGQKIIPNVEANIEVIGLETFKKAVKGEPVASGPTIRRKAVAYAGAVPLAGVDILQGQDIPLENYRTMAEDLALDASGASWENIRGDQRKVEAKKAWRQTEVRALNSWIESKSPSEESKEPLAESDQILERISAVDPAATSGAESRVRTAFVPVDEQVVLTEFVDGLLSAGVASRDTWLDWIRKSYDLSDLPQKARSTAIEVYENIEGRMPGIGVGNFLVENKDVIVARLIAKSHALSVKGGTVALAAVSAIFAGMIAVSAPGSGSDFLKEFTQLLFSSSDDFFRNLWMFMIFGYIFLKIVFPRSVYEIPGALFAVLGITGVVLSVQAMHPDLIPSTVQAVAAYPLASLGIVGFFWASLFFFHRYFKILHTDASSEIVRGKTSPNDLPKETIPGALCVLCAFVGGVIGAWAGGASTLGDSSLQAGNLFMAGLGAAAGLVGGAFMAVCASVILWVAYCFGVAEGLWGKTKAVPAQWHILVRSKTISGKITTNAGRQSSVFGLQSEKVRSEMRTGRSGISSTLDVQKNPVEEFQKLLAGIIGNYSILSAVADFERAMDFLKSSQRKEWKPEAKHAMFERLVRFFPNAKRVEELEEIALRVERAGLNVDDLAAEKAAAEARSRPVFGKQRRSEARAFQGVPRVVATARPSVRATPVPRVVATAKPLPDSVILNKAADQVLAALTRTDSHEPAVLKQIIAETATDASFQIAIFLFFMNGHRETDPKKNFEGRIAQARTTLANLQRSGLPGKVDAGFGSLQNKFLSLAKVVTDPKDPEVAAAGDAVQFDGKDYLPRMFEVLVKKLVVAGLIPDETSVHYRDLAGQEPHVNLDKVQYLIPGNINEFVSALNQKIAGETAKYRADFTASFPEVLATFAAAEPAEQEEMTEPSELVQPSEQAEFVEPSEPAEQAVEEVPARVLVESTVSARTFSRILEHFQQDWRWDTVQDFSGYLLSLGEPREDGKFSGLSLLENGHIYLFDPEIPEKVLDLGTEIQAVLMSGDTIFGIVTHSALAPIPGREELFNTVKKQANPYGYLVPQPARAKPVETAPRPPKQPLVVHVRSEARDGNEEGQARDVVEIYQRARNGAGVPSWIYLHDNEVNFSERKGFAFFVALGLSGELGEAPRELTYHIYAVPENPLIPFNGEAAAQEKNYEGDLHVGLDGEGTVASWKFNPYEKRDTLLWLPLSLDAWMETQKGTPWIARSEIRVENEKQGAKAQDPRQATVKIVEELHTDYKVSYERVISYEGDAQAFGIERKNFDRLKNQLDRFSPVFYKKANGWGSHLSDGPVFIYFQKDPESGEKAATRMMQLNRAGDDWVNWLELSDMSQFRLGLLQVQEPESIMKLDATVLQYNFSEKPFLQMPAQRSESRNVFSALNSGKEVVFNKAVEFFSPTDAAIGRIQENRSWQALVAALKSAAQGDVDEPKFKAALDRISGVGRYLPTFKSRAWFSFDKEGRVFSMGSDSTETIVAFGLSQIPGEDSRNIISAPESVRLRVSKIERPEGKKAALFALKVNARSELRMADARENARSRKEGLRILALTAALAVPLWFVEQTRPEQVSKAPVPVKNAMPSKLSFPASRPAEDSDKTRAETRSELQRVPGEKQGANGQLIADTKGALARLFNEHYSTFSVRDLENYLPKYPLHELRATFRALKEQGFLKETSSQVQGRVRVFHYAFSDAAKDYYGSRVSALLGTPVSRAMTLNRSEAREVEGKMREVQAPRHTVARNVSVITPAMLVLLKKFYFDILPFRFFRAIEASEGLSEVASMLRKTLSIPVSYASNGELVETTVLDAVLPGEGRGVIMRAAFKKDPVASSKSQNVREVSGTLAIGQDMLLAYVSHAPQALYYLLKQFVDAETPALMTVGSEGLTLAAIKRAIAKKGVVPADEFEMLRQITEALDRGTILRVVVPRNGDTEAVTLNKLAGEVQGGIATIHLKQAMLAGLDDGAHFAFGENIGDKDLMVATALGIAAKSLADLIRNVPDPKLRGELLAKFVNENFPGVRKNGAGFIVEHIAALAQHFVEQAVIARAA